MDGAKFINDYIFFIRDLNVDVFRNQLNSKIQNKIKLYKQNLDIAKEIGINDPIFRNKDVTVFVSKELYFQGTKVLNKKIKYLEELVASLNNENFQYNPLLDKATVSIKDPISKFKYPLIGLIFGIFLSFSIILLRDSKKN